jgi:hypothetical protein
LASDDAAGLTVAVGISTTCKQMVSQKYDSRSIPLLGLRRDEARGLKAEQRHLWDAHCRPSETMCCCRVKQLMAGADADAAQLHGMLLLYPHAHTCKHTQTHAHANTRTHTHSVCAHINTHISHDFRHV